MTTNRRLLFVDHAGVLGGAEFSLLDVIDAYMPGAGVTLFADGPFRTVLEQRGVPVEVDPLGAFAGVKKSGRLPSPPAVWDAFSHARQLARRARSFDVLYANSQKAFVVSAIAGWLAGRPVVWHLRDILAPPHFTSANARAVVWLANRAAARVIANSHATAAAFVSAGGNAALVCVVHNGIDAAPFDAVTDGEAHSCRAELGVTSGVPLIVHVGRFHYWKGQHVLLRALADVPSAQAWFVGAPLFGEEVYATKLRAEADALGVSSRVQFLGFRDDVARLMRAADVIVHSSVYPEPFGRVVVEGMLAGRPVIASRAGGVEEIVTDRETGWLVPPGDAGALAQAISAVIADPELATLTATRGAKHARGHFTRAAMVRGVIEAVERA